MMTVCNKNLLLLGISFMLFSPLTKPSKRCRMVLKIDQVLIFFLNFQATSVIKIIAESKKTTRPIFSPKPSLGLIYFTAMAEILSNSMINPKRVMAKIMKRSAILSTTIVPIAFSTGILSYLAIDPSLSTYPKRGIDRFER